MSYWLMIFLSVFGVPALDAKQLAAQGHNLFLQVLAGDRGKLPEAVAAMEQSREADPAYVFNLYNLGRIYFFSSQIDKAAETFAKVVELDPKHSKALAFHGAMLTAQSGGRDLAKFFQGVQEMRKAIEMDPNDINNHIVMPFTALNFPPEALKAMGNYDPLVDLQFVSKAFDGAKPYYAPHADVVIKAMIGDVYAQRGDAAKARTQFESALAVAKPQLAGPASGRKVLDGLITERMNGGEKSLRNGVIGSCHACHLSTQ